MSIHRLHFNFFGNNKNVIILLIWMPCISYEKAAQTTYQDKIRKKMVLSVDSMNTSTIG